MPPSASTRTTLQSVRSSSLPVALSTALLVVVAVAARGLLWPMSTGDVTDFYVPWLEHLRAFGFDGLRTTDANYNPPYLYLLLLGGWIWPSLSAISVVKAVAVAFELLLAIAVARLVAGGGEGRGLSRGALAGAGVLLLPTVALNAAGWGQCDAIYTTFLLLGIAAAERDHEAGAAAGFATAFAFKLQAAFGGPAILAYWLPARHRARQLLVAAAVYAAWLVPMLAAGRPLADTAGTYLRQGTYFNELALGAPNLWTILKYALPGPTGYRIGVAAGLAVTLAASALFVPVATRVMRQRPERRLELFFTAYFAAPFLLPKMHDRYFFVADVVSFVLAARDRRWLPVAVLVQVGSLSAYWAYLGAVRWPRPFGIAANCVVMILLWRHWRRHGAAAAGHAEGAAQGR